MKTPEEVKKELRLCKDNSFCEWCGMNDQCEKNEYVIECIEHLESDNERQQKRIAELESRLAQVERERDALKHDLTACFIRPTKMCRVCKNTKTNLCNSCERGDLFKWRGVCPENTKGDANA